MLEASRAGEADRKTGADWRCHWPRCPEGSGRTSRRCDSHCRARRIRRDFRLDKSRSPPIHIMATAVSIVAVASWAAYHFLFMVYTGSLRLRLARLQLVRFDGSMTKRRVRRWRVLASYVSAFPSDSGIYGAFSTKMACAGTTASPTPTLLERAAQKLRGSRLNLDICGPGAGVLPQTCKLFQLAGHFPEILSPLCGICGPTRGSMLHSATLQLGFLSLPQNPFPSIIV